MHMDEGDLKKESMWPILPATNLSDWPLTKCYNINKKQTIENNKDNQLASL